LDEFRKLGLTSFNSTQVSFGIICCGSASLSIAERMISSYCSRSARPCRV